MCCCRPVFNAGRVRCVELDMYAGRRRFYGFCFCLIFATFTISLPPGIVQAQDEGNSSVTLVVSEVRTLSIDADGGFLSPDASAVLDGWSEERTCDIIISANTEWVLRIRGSSPVWDAPWQKPVSDIYYSCSDGDFIPLTTTPNDILVGGPAINGTIPVTFKIKLDPLHDIPGEYYYNAIELELIAP